MPPKRKAPPAAEDEAAAGSPNLRRSTRRKSSAPVDATKTATATKASTTAKGKASAATQAEKRSSGSGRRSTSKTDGTSKENPSNDTQADDKPKSTKATKVIAKESPPGTKSDVGPTDPSNEKSYWLLKAEPETRLENGVDVRFSIDDLASRTEPEPWDGIRNYAARNNLRAMKKGDIAFFYHSNCKEPGIVGTMEIVREHSPDLSAHDSKAPYYDASSKPSDPKWSVVHVEFRSKFAQQIGLKELREMGKPGQPLENMQLLKQSRLSVSRVAPTEFEYLMKVATERGGMSKAD
ncbi:hypothetical protein PG995_008103 [Apiospora arundinis]